MRVLDEEGRVFGRVNVIDALVVVFAVVLVVSGVFVVINDDQPDKNIDDGPYRDLPARYATLTYTVPLDHPAAELAEGTNLSNRSQHTNINDVTDVHRSLTAGGDAHVVARVEYRGTSIDGSGPSFVGDSLELTTGTVQLETEILAIDVASSSIRTEETTVVVVNSTRYGAGAVTEDDEISVGGEVVGSVDAVETRPNGRTLIGLTLETRETSIGSSFGGRTIRVGEEMGIVTDRAIMRGRIVAVGTSDPASVE